MSHMETSRTEEVIDGRAPPHHSKELLGSWGSTDIVDSPFIALVQFVCIISLNPAGNPLEKE